ncbi:2-amino-4-hydroxy-6-hydroxymethyldihydropteridine diphosphokinase [Hellea sp.]|nr:2-amino-4-hydroxy-6-hydroxymethyldihydropteridine diphosphokinase [Hellea sp.]
MSKNIKPIYIAFGANLSNPKETFPAAIKALESRGVKLIKMSGLWQSPAWPPGSDQPDYINACAEVGFNGTARALLNILHDVEAEFGRNRTVKNAARQLDLDLLDYRGQIIEDKGGMIVPHPRMLSRGFVLFPLSEIAEDWRDPIQANDLTYWTARLPLADVKDTMWLGRV